VKRIRWCFAGLFLSHPALAWDDVFEETVKEADAVEGPVSSLSAEFGGTSVGGNTETALVYTKVDASYRWSWNEISNKGWAELGRSIVDSDADGMLEEHERANGYQRTAQEMGLDVRYDRFLTDIDSLYGMMGWFHDPFLGYRWRAHTQAGYSRAIWVTEAYELLAESGMDVAREAYVEGVEPPIDTIFSARGFLSWSAAFGDVLELSESIETYVNVEDAEDVRLINEAGLSLRANDMLSLKTSYRIQHDTVPVEGYESTDKTLALTLVASLSNG